MYTAILYKAKYNNNNIPFFTRVGIIIRCCRRKLYCRALCFPSVQYIIIILFNYYPYYIIIISTCHGTVHLPFSPPHRRSAAVYRSFDIAVLVLRDNNVILDFEPHHMGTIYLPNYVHRESYMAFQRRDGVLFLDT